jgi:glycopeptide antibiotics resistance protein
MRILEILTVCCGMLAVVLIILFSAGAFKYQQPAPNSFDSMLCRVHVPLATKLITDELITCTNGKKYRRTK